MSIIKLTPEQTAAYETAQEKEQGKDSIREQTSLVNTLAKLAADKTTRHGGGGQGISGQRGLMRWVYERSSEPVTLPGSRSSDDEPLPGFRLNAQSIDIVRRGILRERTLVSTILNVTIERGVADEQIGWPGGLVSPTPIVKATVYPPSIQAEDENGALGEIEPGSPPWMQVVELVEILESNLPAA